jgi:thiol-disulfide isomerase/thioredoxin
MVLRIIKSISFFVFYFIFSCTFTITNAQDFSINSVIFRQNGYVEYYHSYHPLSHKVSVHRYFKLWYCSSPEAKSIKSFVLTDSLETIVYANNILEHYIHKTRKKYIDTISNADVYPIYQHKRSLPHISPIDLYQKNIEKGNLNIYKIDDSLYIKIDVTRNDASTLPSRFSITSEFVDSFITKYTYTNFKTPGDSSVLEIKYLKPENEIEVTQIDSIVEYFNNQFRSYKCVNTNSSAFRPTSQFSQKYPTVDSVVNLTDSVFNIFDSTAKLIILDFWYMGCAPCIKAIPFMNKLYSTYYSEGLRIYGVNQFDTSKNIIDEFISRKGIVYPVLLKSLNPYFNTFNIRVFPTMIILDKYGNLILNYEGYSSALDKEIEENIIINLKNK